MRVYQKGQLVLDEKVQDQVTINTDAKETIKDLFPKIPDNDLYQIIKTAFQLGDGKVGTADEIPLVRRAQLSVVAHIRHTYTSYDRLLRRLPYNEARHQVEEETLKKLVEWRGDDDEKADESRRRAVDDLVRDVIVVSDDDDSTSDVDDEERIQQDNLRVEELPSDAYAPQVNRASPSRGLMYEEASAGYRFVPQVTRRARLTDAEIDAHRFAVWERARQAYKTRNPEPEPQYERMYVGRASPVVRTLMPLDPPSGSVIRREYLGPSQGPRTHEYEVGSCLEDSSLPVSPTSPSFHYKTYANCQQMLPPSRPSSPPRYTGITADGRRYERIPLEAQSNSLRRLTPPSGSRIRSRPVTPVGTQYGRRRSVSPDAGYDNIIPSIEGPNGPFSPTQARHPRPDQTRTWPTPPSNYVNAREVQRQPQSIIDLTSSQESPYPNRRVDGNFDNPFQRREQVYAGTPQHSQTTFSYPERRMIEIEPRVGDRIVREPWYAQPETRYRDVHEIETSGTRRILLSEDDQYRRVAVSARNDAFTRTNPFDTRPSVTQYRVLEPINTAHEQARAENRNRPLSPPRRVLPALPPERHSTQPYGPGSQMSARMLYTAPPGQVQDRR